MSDTPPERPKQSTHAHVQAQFGPVADAYVTSASHAAGRDLARMVELARPVGHEHVLDVATGEGHTARVFAAQTAHVVASDLTLPMILAARRHLTAYGLTNVAYCCAAAESLPFANASFRIVTCRVAAHHFADPGAFAAESARVLKPGGQLIISDHLGLDDASLDAFMDMFERWRDPSHVRAYRESEWQCFFEQAGLQFMHSEQDPREPYDFETWTARMRMPPHERLALETWLLAAPARCRDFFEIVEQDHHVRSLRGHFGILVAQKKI